MVIVALATMLLLGLGDLGNQRLGRQQERGDAGGILERCPHHLGRIDDAGGNKVTVDLLVGIVAVVLPLHVADTVDHHRAVDAGVGGDRFERISEGVLHDRSAELLIAFEIEFLDRLLAAKKGDAAARDDPLGEGRLGGALGILDESLALLHLGLSGRPDVDLGNTAGEFRESLLEFLTIVIAVGDLDLGTDLGRPAVDRRLRTGPADDRGVFAVDDHLLGTAEVSELDGVEGDAEILEDRLTAGQNGQIAHDRLATVTVAGGLHGHRLDDAAEFVDNQRSQRLPLNILSDDHQRLARLADRFEKRNKVLGRGDLLLEQEDVRVFVLADLRIGIGNEVRGEIAAVELHSLDDVDGRLRLLPLLDRDHAVLANLQKSLGEDAADRRIVVASDRRDLHQLLLVLLIDRRRHGEDRFRDRLDRLVDAA